METVYHSQGSTSVLIPNRFETKQKNNTPNRADAPMEVPPSPTLTNPDMILPDDGERQSTTPSPPFQLTPSDPHVLSNGVSQSSNGVVYGQANGYPRASRQRWTYDSHAHGRPLSDIGEEDYQPSSPAQANNYSSQPYGHKSDVESDDSGSTISASSQRELHVDAEGIDGNAGGSGHDSGFSSKRGSYASLRSIERERAHTEDVLASRSSHQPSGKEEEGNREDGSSAILSSEAERILENAKRRLTLMEGNLSRARSSIRLGQTPSPSPSPSGHLLPSRNLQPVGALYRSISQTDRRVPSLRPRQVYATPQDGGHSRGHSETNLPSAASLASPALQPSRSMSALGTTNSAHYGTQETIFTFTQTENNAAASPRQEYRGDDDNRKSHLSPVVDSAAGLGISDSYAAPKMSSMEDFNSAYPSDGPPSRAQSQLQVRDLKDQAAGLRTKVALLRIKTQEDNLRRRSLQSLRTPSPFTTTERWYSSSLEHGNGAADEHNNAGYGWVSEPRTPATAQGSNSDSNSKSTSIGKEGSTTDTHKFSGTQNINGQYVQYVQDDSYFNTDNRSISESHYEDAEEGDYFDDEEEQYLDQERYGEMMNEDFEEDDTSVFLDTVSGTAPEATPHEEREDAFDYENFYLHSALGTFSRNKIRRNSYGSTGSTETTRPVQDRRPGTHNRNGSSDSVSTFATFATATENAYDDDGIYDEEIDNGPRALNQVANSWSDSGDEEDASTPVQSRRATATERPDPSFYSSAMRRNQDHRSFTPTGKTLPVGRIPSTPTTPVDAFMSSLSARSASARPSSSLNTDDTRLLEQVFESLGKVCVELQELTINMATTTASSVGTNGYLVGADTNADEALIADAKYIRTLRRRLDAARRVLDGQLDSDA